MPPDVAYITAEPSFLPLILPFSTVTISGLEVVHFISALSVTSSENPLEAVPDDYEYGISYNSDTELVYNSDTDTLECWWRKPLQFQG